MTSIKLINFCINYYYNLFKLYTFKSVYFIVIFYQTHNLYIILNIIFNIIIIFYRYKFETQFFLNFRGCIYP